MIKDKNIRDRFAELGLDDSKKVKEYQDTLDSFTFLLFKVEQKIKNIENSLNIARKCRSDLNIKIDFSLIEEIDKKINSLSIKKVVLEKKFKEIEEYIKIEKGKNAKEKY